MSEPATLTVGGTVDWKFAGNVGAQLVRPEPPASEYTRRQAVDDLAESAVAAEAPVREVSLLGSDAPVSPARIVDRKQWIHAASESMRVMTGGSDRPAGAVTGRIAGAQTGAVLAFISSGILGQYDPFAPGGQERSDRGIAPGGQERSDRGNAPGGEQQGDLLLVYPNVIAVERQLHLNPKDFRLWVCLHEVTHRVQFTANPWLTQHMSNALAVLSAERGDDVGKVIGRLADFVKDRRRADGGDGQNAGVIGLLRAVQSEPQQRALDELLVLGTLLEGHADYVMDAVGPAVVPSVHLIRRRFDDRRGRKHPPLQRLVRALLGVDAKLSQYTRGRAFVDHVVDRVGMERFNAVWTDSGTLPRPDEIEDPQRWIDRVL
jgi:coenzyme F420 biosynthesis associated uncharacterized protein